MERDGSPYRSPLLPVTRVGHHQRTRDVGAVEFDVESSAGAGRRHSELEHVGARPRHVDRVRQPFRSPGPADGVAALARISDVDIALAILAADVAWRVIVIGNTLASLVEILCLDQSWQRSGLAAKRFLS